MNYIFYVEDSECLFFILNNLGNCIYIEITCNFSLGKLQRCT